MLSAVDLQRVSADRAEAVLVLCDKFSTDPSRYTYTTALHHFTVLCREDASNIMRVISLKNYCESTRCVIQLLHYHNKAGTSSYYERKELNCTLYSISYHSVCLLKHCKQANIGCRVLCKVGAAARGNCHNKANKRPHNTVCRNRPDYLFSLNIIVGQTALLLQAFLLNIPGWDWRRDDQAVCLNEVICIMIIGPASASNPANPIQQIQLIKLLGWR